MDNVSIKIVRSGRRTIGLEVNRDGGVIVRAPFKASQAQIDKIITSHSEWIREKVVQIQERISQCPPKTFTHGEQFLYRGDYYPLIISDTTARGINFDQGFYAPSLHSTRIKKLFTDWYKERARMAFLDRVCYYTAQTSSRALTMRLSSAKTRWGSCSIRGSLNFNWRLIMAPPNILDYVVVHEIIHLQEHNHSVNFWKKVEKHYPEYKKAVRWLKENGHLLNW